MRDKNYFSTMALCKLSAFLLLGLVGLLLCLSPSGVQAKPVKDKPTTFHRLQVVKETPEIRKAHYLSEVVDKVKKSLAGRALDVTCDVCALGMDLLRQMVDENKTDDEIIDTVTDLCVSLGIEPEGVCRGMLDLAIPELTYIFKIIETNISNIENICGMALGGDCVVVDQYLVDYQWTIEFPTPEPPYVPPPTPEPNAPKFRILHLSDVHLDLLYQEGSVVNCDEPLCCRQWSRTPEEVVTLSGKWGAFGSCDLPQVTLENMLEFITQNVEFDAVYWTGDIPPHDVYNQTKDGNLETLRQTSAVIKRYIPEKIVYPAVGNHESAPVNSFPVPPVYQDYGIAYLYTQLNETWHEFVPDLEDDLVLKGGYYWSQIRPGLRLISLNMNYCHGANWWLLVQNQDPTEEIKWLIDQLEDAEKNNIKVHIIGHIPPGQCEYVWSRNFRDILDRYKNTIAGHFYGHTHDDEFEIVYDDEDTTAPISMVNIGPSVTTYSNGNPAFRVYTVDGDYDGSSWTVLDYEEYYMDVNQANIDGTPVWTKLYSAVEAYGLSAYTPTEWNNLINRMETDDALFQLFYQHYHRVPNAIPCEGGCKTGLLCSLRTGWSGYTC